MNSLIECKNLTLGYDGEVLLSGINFTVNEGDYLCILGENGSGKTTLMKTILGLKKPVSGNIVFGQGLTQNEIGYLPQQTPVQRDFPATAMEIVLSGFVGKMKLFKPFYDKPQRERAKKSMEMLGISDISNRCYRELSGGQQQRVLLARALCAAEKIILLDEPVASLDPSATEEFYNMLYKLNKEENITIIMISHDALAAQKYANHTLHVGEGGATYE